MESTNLCVALWAMIDLWHEKQRKVSDVALAQPGICPSVSVPAKAQHDAQHHPFTIYEDLLWNYGQPADWHWSLLPARRAATLASQEPWCHPRDHGSNPYICPLLNTAWSQPGAGQHWDGG